LPRTMRAGISGTSVRLSRHVGRIGFYYQSDQQRRYRQFPRETLGTAEHISDARPLTGTPALQPRVPIPRQLPLSRMVVLPKEGRRQPRHQQAIDGTLSGRKRSDRWGDRLPQEKLAHPLHRRSVHLSAASGFSTPIIQFAQRH
jgi:hypothetical protein